MIGTVGVEALKKESIAKIKKMAQIAHKMETGEIRQQIIVRSLCFLMVSFRLLIRTSVSIIISTLLRQPLASVWVLSPFVIFDSPLLMTF